MFAFVGGKLYKSILYSSPQIISHPYQYSEQFADKNRSRPLEDLNNPAIPNRPVATFEPMVVAPLPPPPPARGIIRPSNISHPISRFSVSSAHRVDWLRIRDAASSYGNATRPHKNDSGR